MARKRVDRIDFVDLDGFHERLATVLAGESETSFAARARISKSGLNRVLRGGMPSLDVLAAIASTAGVSIDWLATGRNDLNGFKAVGAFFPRASAGQGAVQIPSHWSPIERQFGNIGAFRTEWLEAHGFDARSVAALTVVGDSMEPTIRDGDLLIIDRRVERIIDNGIYVITVGDLVFVKRVQVHVDGSVTLRSENAAAGFQDERLSPEQASEIIVEGRVRWFGRSI